MSEMVKRVAAAIEAAGTKWSDEHPFDYWDEAPLEVYARAAIEAMMEPTEEMLNDDGVDAGPRTMRKAWKAMITAALEEK